MELIVNRQNEITAYAISGDLKDSIIYDGNIPDGFEAFFQSKKYALIDNQIILNDTYTPEIEGKPVGGLTQQDEINAHLFKMNLDLQKQLEEMKRVE